MTDTSNNGNGTKLKVEVQETKIDSLMEGQKEILEILKTYFGPDGICPKERSEMAAFKTEVKTKRETIYTHIRGLWFVVVALGGAAWVIIQELWGKN
jgi:hypothetical protein